ncbi:MAG: inorganic diphosphatase [Oscillospiraceae bacterium]|nr:inorganic diphosphatase [Oscillospiraceae bacterium]
MNIWHDLDPARVSPERFIAVIEIAKGGKNKYELDKDTGMLVLDRVLFTSMQYPANYGFIPKTYADDDDPLDVLVLCSESIAPMTLVNCRPIGVLRMTDQGASDEKIIAVCIDDPFYSTYFSINALPPHLFAEIRHFYEVYKTLEQKETSVKTIEDEAKAAEIIQKSIERYKKEFLILNA